VTEAPIVDGKYRLVRLLGEGGMGTVHEARNLVTNRRVAIKLITSKDGLATNEVALARFEREARAAGSIESRHIAQVLDTGFDAQTRQPYMVMEFLAGEDLHAAIARVERLHPEVAMRLAAQACLGLQKAHEAGVIHRDIKSANLFLTRQDGGEILVKLLDFGVAKMKMEQLSAAVDALTRTGSMLGSPHYMSPEQAKGSKNIDVRTDVWSLGVVLYEAITGVVPYAHCDTLGSLILAICSEKPRTVQEHSPWVPPEIATIVHRAMAFDAASRFQSAAEMLDAIKSVLPSGYAVDESMVAPLTRESQGVIAPKAVILSVTPAEASGRHSPLSLASTQLATPATTTPGVDASSPSLPKRSGSALPIALAAVAAVGLGAFGVYRLAGSRGHAPASAAALEPSPAVASTLPLAAASSVPSAVALADLPRTVQLALVPPTVSAEVDGTPVAVIDGHVDLIGPLGSIHHVRASAGRRMAEADVVITEVGAVPPAIAVLSQATPRPTAGSHAAAAGDGAKPGAPPPATTPPKPTQSGGVDRVFQ
jgi:serine/threonine-protein kinase